MHVWEDQWECSQQQTKAKIVKFLNNEPYHPLTKTITIDLATENPEPYLKLGYIVQEYIPPQPYSENIWDCGKIKIINLNLKNNTTRENK